MRSLLALAGVLLLHAILPALSSADGVYGGDRPVVIRASFAPTPMLCPVSLDTNTDGIGSWYVGAPCQRMSMNPFQPWCWQEDEDNCIAVTDESTFEIAGNCQSGDPCKLEYAFSIEFIERCGHDCDGAFCCASGVVRVRTGDNYLLGYIYNDGDPLETSVTGSCPCAELASHACQITAHVECSTGLGYDQMTGFGYNWKCLACEEEH